ncbi:hypothetical protein Afil01_12430 [Actinorhabdospora filicis]|uniref:OmpR/PhoB-type domain-containing protein n=1 Tax=Actinorhabdospora filicis TaxID=1785913 RepID=A0A9W6SKT7_9ACTN|nr:BTAD domain-containing putative transcriptional regulator [Actinorhabdospora filicis]GLZ76436.1 hypothetical protein Afil01_12430 [Actinorhabdospora filicis]
MSIAPVPHVRLLGPVQVEYQGTPLPLGGPRQLALLAMLVWADARVLTVDEIIEGVWGDDAPPRARHSVRAYISRLRTALSPTGAEFTWAGGYALILPPGSTVDVREHRRLREAASAATETCVAAQLLREAESMHRGLALTGLPGPFAARQQIQWAERALAVREERLALDVACGRPGAAIAELLDLTAAHPVRESLHATFMRALAAAGRQAEAVDVYHRLTRRLADDYGLDPGAALREAYLGVLRAEAPGLAPVIPIRRRLAAAR